MLGVDALIERAHAAVGVTGNVPAVGDAIDVLQFESGLPETVIDRPDGKDVRSVLVSQQPFFFHIALDDAIAQQAGGWIDPAEVTNDHHKILSFSAPVHSAAPRLRTAVPAPTRQVIGAIECTRWSDP